MDIAGVGCHQVRKCMLSVQTPATSDHGCLRLSACNEHTLCRHGLLVACTLQGSRDAPSTSVCIHAAATSSSGQQPSCGMLCSLQVCNLPAATCVLCTVCCVPQAHVHGALPDPDQRPAGPAGSRAGSPAAARPTGAQLPAASVRYGRRRGLLRPLLFLQLLVHNHRILPHMFAYSTSMPRGVPQHTA
jgi:hypothetical protein